MPAGVLHQRYERLSPELSESRYRIEIRHDDDGVIFKTTDRHVRRVRQVLTLSATIAAAAGIVGVIILTWWCSLVVLGGLVAALAARRVRSSVLLRIDAEAGTLHIHQKSAANGEVIPLEQITAVEGRFEVFGWDPRSVIYVKRQSGDEVAALILSGGQEKLAAFVCRALGTLLDVPSRYRETLRST